MYKFLCGLFLPLLLVLSACDSEKPKELVVRMKVDDEALGTGDPPLIGLWLEKDGQFITTLNMFSSDIYRYGYLNEWRQKSRVAGQANIPDAVTSATFIWGEEREIVYPLVGDLAVDGSSNGFTLLVESRCDDDQPAFVLKLPLSAKKDQIQTATSSEGSVRKIEAFIR